ncbi:MAG: hypothetical protein CENE_03125 [Candidatus Celerinatantimonas neptuna]|nr:MAG: hypothetical protein CENE_03125 [Candidatus Celerinatantimonas neptuna]
MKSLALIALALPFLAQAQCVVNDQWLNRNYDQHIDYSNPNVQTDFFLLVFSNSPQFCKKEQQSGAIENFRFQCESPNHFGWVIHGLWGNSREAFISGNIRSQPRFCQGDLPKVPLSELKPYLCMSPGTKLLQGEWEKHGACDFSSAKAYFSKEKELYQRFKLPSADVNAKTAVRWMRDNNPVLADKWLYRRGSEFGICFDRSFNVISCPKQSR